MNNVSHDKLIVWLDTIISLDSGIIHLVLVNGGKRIPGVTNMSDVRTTFTVSQVLT